MGFECYHPAINFIYFVSVIAAGIIFKQPVFLAIAFISAFIYSVKRNGWRSLIFNLALIPCIILFGMYYSGYHHFGATVLRYNFIENRLTLESLVYGLTLGVIVAVFFMWMSVVNSVFTTDKVVYLFGKVSPKLSLFFSIALRMVPRFKVQAKKISTARTAIGKGINQGNIFRRFLNAIKILSMVITWFLESLSTISDSMRSRGYGLKGRSAFSIYRFDNRDRGFVIGIFSCITVLMMGVMLNQTTIFFDPRISMTPITPMSFVFYFGYLCLCTMPMVLEIIGEIRFKNMRSAVK